MKTILFIGNSFTYGGGAAKVAAMTIESLSNCDYKIYKASEDSLNTEESVQLYSWQKTNLLKRPFSSVLFLKNYFILKNYFKERELDIIHLQGFLSSLSPSVLLFLKKQKKLGVKIVFTAHEYSGVCANSCLYNYSKEQICTKCVGSKFKFRCALENCDRRGVFYSILKGLRGFIYYNLLKMKDLFDVVICVSEFQKNFYLKDGYKENKLIVIDNPISNVFFSRELTDKKNQIIYYGRISQEKNIETIIYSFAKLIQEDQFKDYLLIIIGKSEKPSYIEKLKNLAEEKNIMNKIIWKDALPQKDLLKDLKKSKLSILSSKWYETFGLVVVESIMAGTPILVADIGAIKETANRYGGELFSCQKKDSLYEKMKNYILNYQYNFTNFLDHRTKILKIIEQQNKQYLEKLKHIYEEKSI